MEIIETHEFTCNGPTCAKRVTSSEATPPSPWQTIRQVGGGVKYYCSYECLEMRAVMSALATIGPKKKHEKKRPLGNISD